MSSLIFFMKQFMILDKQDIKFRALKSLELTSQLRLQGLSLKKRYLAFIFKSCNSEYEKEFLV